MRLAHMHEEEGGHARWAPLLSRVPTARIGAIAIAWYWG